MVNSVHHIIAIWTFPKPAEGGQKRIMRSAAKEISKSLKIVIEAHTPCVIKTHLYHRKIGVIQRVLLAMWDVTGQETTLDIKRNPHHSSSTTPAKSMIVLMRKTQRDNMNPSDGDSDVGEVGEWKHGVTEQMKETVRRELANVVDEERHDISIASVTSPDDVDSQFSGISIEGRTITHMTDSVNEESDAADVVSINTLSSAVESEPAVVVDPNTLDREVLLVLVKQLMDKNNRIEDEKKRVEDEKKRVEDEKKRVEDEKKRVEDEKKREKRSFELRIEELQRTDLLHRQTISNMKVKLKRMRRDLRPTTSGSRHSDRE